MHGVEVEEESEQITDSDKKPQQISGVDKESIQILESRFIAHQELWKRGEWIAGQEYPVKTHLICLSCRNRYPLQHPFCGTYLHVETALSPRGRCPMCLHNGQIGSSSILEGVADCPKCLAKCRVLKQVNVEQT
ncbi:hypothetical protein M1N56_05335, partial [Dehalococcoidia bacterium]|nr:hypothetical protein [Dehalococcoidia bacterium]